MSKMKAVEVSHASITECVLQTSAPKSRILAVPTNQISDAEMIVVRDGVAWLGRVQPEDMRHISLTRKGRRYVLEDGEYQLFRRKG